MLQRTTHVLIVFALMFFLGANVVSAASFGRIDVASHLEEPFFAEVPLSLNGEEEFSKVLVEIGQPSDYRILEVYRDQVVANIRVEVIQDERGARAVLTSKTPIDKAFFNLVLKVRYGRSTHYKKMPIFLDSAVVNAAVQAQKEEVKTAPAVNSVLFGDKTSNAFIKKDEDAAKVDFEEKPEPVAEPALASDFKSYSNWARTSRYGPMVFGDTITTVAKRLRVDERFSNDQVMVALFEKNKDQFSKENINLINVGTYLDVPTEDEVSQVSVARAQQVLKEQSKAWKEMLKQPKYAAVADAQKMRYTRRVRVGTNATGVASAPMVAAKATEDVKPAEVVQKVNDQAIVEANQELDKLKEKLQAAESTIAEKDTLLSELQAKVTHMETRVAEAEQKVSTAVPVQDSGYATVNPEVAALEAQSKKLEIVITRLKAQLEQAKAEAETNTSQGGDDWITYALVAGGGVLLVSLMAAAVLFLRRRPKHPGKRDIGLEDTGRQYVDDAETFSSASVATRVMESKGFEPKADFSEDSAAIDGMFDEAPLEEIPELTDHETGSMEPFNDEDDEIPDPNVNYLEEAEVYLRYGMEDEAKKQVLLALKLKKDDPHAHAKLVQLERARGDAAAESEAMTNAKAILAGAALITFEELLHGGSDISAADNGEMGIADLNQDFTGDDTGMVDFGDIDFGSSNQPAEDVMEEDAIDTGGMDFGDLDFNVDNSGATGFEESDSGELDFGSIGVSDVEEQKSADSDLDSLDFDFSGMGAEDDLTSDASASQAATSEDDDSLDFDFGSMLTSDEEAVKSEPDVHAADIADESDIADIDFDFSSMSLEGDSAVAAEGVDEDFDSTAALSFHDETVAVSYGSADEDADHYEDDRKADLAKAEAEERANAVAVDLNLNADDPFADANESLIKASSDDMSLNWSDDDFSNLLVDGSDDLLSLQDNAAAADEDHGLDLVAIDEEALTDADVSTADELGDDLLSMDLDSEAGVAGSSIGISDDDHDFGFDDLALDEIESPSLPEALKPKTSEADDFGLADFSFDSDSDDLDFGDFSSTANAKPEADALIGDDFGLEDLSFDNDSGDMDLADFDSAANAKPEADDSISDDFGLGDLSFGADSGDLGMVEEAGVATSEAEDLASDDFGLDDLSFGADSGDMDLGDLGLVEEDGVAKSETDDFASDDFGLDDLSFGDDSGDMDLGDLGLVEETGAAKPETDDSDGNDFGLSDISFDDSDDMDFGDFGVTENEDKPDVSDLISDDFGLDDFSFETDSVDLDKVDISNNEQPATAKPAKEDLDANDFGLDEFGFDHHSNGMDSLNMSLDDDFDSTMILNQVHDDMKHFIGDSANASLMKDTTPANGEAAGGSIHDFSLDNVDSDTPSAFELSGKGSLSQSMTLDDDFDSTMILNQVSSDMESVIKKESKHISLDDVLNDSGKKDPMADDYSATVDLNEIHDAMSDLEIGTVKIDSSKSGKSSELDDMLNDLDDLLKGDDLK